MIEPHDSGPDARTVAEALRNPVVVEFVTLQPKLDIASLSVPQTIRSAPWWTSALRSLPAAKRDRIDTRQLVEVTSELLEHTFRKRPFILVQSGLSPV
jgi:hypothetical protein